MSDNYNQYDREQEMERRREEKRRQLREKRRKERERQMKIRRGIVIVLLLIIVVLIIVLISSCCRACGKDDGTSSQTSSQTAVENASDTQENSTEPSDDTAATQPSVQETAVKPAIEDDGQSVGQMDGSVYVWKQKAFELFYGDADMAQPYAQFINSASQTLAERGITTFSMIVPNHTEFGLPERLKNTDVGISTESQLDYINAAYNSMNRNTVIPINPYNKLAEHCNEYIYFNSDHHWTGLGAYYAYAAFAEQNGLPVLSLADCTEKSVDGFSGTLGNIAESPLEEDSVHYWVFPYEVNNTITESDGSVFEMDSCYYEDSDNYGLFLCGDNPLEVITSQSPAANGQKIAIVHESYGNAFTPYLTYNFSEVYSIDFRSWEGNLGNFCTEHGISHVIFLNGVMSSATQIQIDSMESIV